LDETAKPFYANLAQSLPGTSVRWLSSSADGSQRIVQNWSARDPGRSYLFDGRNKTLSLLGQTCVDLPAAAMAEVRYFTYQTRDAVSESGYVVLPAKTQAGPPPLLLFPMQFVGESADPGRGFNKLAQFFASRGFAVARFATRGSFGFGRIFEKAGDFQVDGRIVQDAEDGVNDLARQGLVDSHRVGILGWGASGIIALRMAASSPLFRAVAVVNSWARFDVNNISWLTSSRAPGDTIIDQLGGDQTVYDKFTHQLDPEVSVKSLSATTFIAYSSWYDRTPEAAGRLRGFFQRYKKPYEWYELDVHQANRPEVEVYEYDARLYTKIVDFLRRTL
jgi:dienelactone hydrolase